MKSFRAYFQPGDDDSPLASAMEIVDCAMARKAAPSPEDLAHLARLLVANMVSIFTAIDLGEDLTAEAAQSVLENVAQNNVNALRHLGLTLAEVEQAGTRLLRDAMIASGKED